MTVKVYMSNFFVIDILVLDVGKKPLRFKYAYVMYSFCNDGIW